MDEEGAMRVNGLNPLLICGCKKFSPMAESVNSVFYNKVMDRTAIKQLIRRLIAHFGITYTTHVLDQLKTLGFQQATLGAISLGIDDLSTAPSKGWLIEDAEQYGNLSEKHHNYGNLHAVEKLRQLIETWYATSEYLKQEMNPNFKMTDPLNPVHMMSFSGARGSTSQVHQLVGMRGLMSDPQGQIIDLPIRSNFREGLSLTEYIISCYGARKGVVDTAVRTSDAGYLTRRLVEVVQHIVVREIDCGTPSGIFMSNPRGRRGIHYQNLVGRVLAENIYINNRCFAARNQDIGASLADGLVTSKTEPISIRSPLTCRSMLWICQLCYGWSLTSGNLVEMGEAVGIIAGQSIGEPGTQSTLRTFHTGGVFTGDIAEHVRTPFNGIIKFNESFVYPTRTRHGHPAWMCHTGLFLSIRSRSEVQNITIPPKSLLLVQNSQYVESKQVIAEIRAGASPFKEKVRKYIHSNLGGEMHWNTKVRHASEYIRSDIHPILKTCHIWVLSGNSYDKNDELPVSFYRNQDRIDSRTFISKRKSLYPFLVNKNRLNICILNSHFSRKNVILTRSGLTWTTFNGLSNSINCNIIFCGYSIGKERENLLLKKEYVTLPFVLKIRKSGILQNNDVFAILDNPEYGLKEPGIVKYGTVKIDLISKSDNFGDAKTKSFRPGYRIAKRGNFFFIPGEVSAQASSLLSAINNKSVSAIITSSITSGDQSVEIEGGMNDTYKVKIPPGTIYYPNGTYRISKQVSISVPPRKKLFNEFRFNHWTYLQWIIPPKEKPFVSMRPAIEYKISDKSNKTNLLNLLERSTNLEIRTANYLLYGDGERIQVGEGNIRLTRTCLIVHWRRRYFSEKAHVSFLRIRTRNNSRNFLQISLMNRPFSKKKEREGVLDSQYVLRRKNCCNNVSSIFEDRLITKHRGIIRTSSNQNNEVQSFIILSPSDLVEIPKIDESRNSITRKSIKNSFSVEFFDFRKPPEDLNFIDQPKAVNTLENTSLEKSVGVILFDKSGFMGNLQNAASLCFYRVAHAEAMASNSSIINRSRNSLQNLKWYFIDEYRKIHKFIFGNSINRNLFSRWCSPLVHLSEETPQSPDLNLGQFLLESFYTSKYEEIFPPGQIIGMHKHYLVVRLAKPYSATEGAIVHNNFGESIKEGDTPITLVYERLRSGDIIQGLPRVEQLLEARSINSISINLDNGFEDWNSDMKGFIGNLWGFFLSTKIGIEQGQTNLVDQIQKVYQSQGVYVSNKHIEIIVRQMTSKVATSENGMINIFSPGELIESSRARKMNRVLEEAIPYKPILLGITRASLNTQSFISEASFQETTRVLAKAALKGRTDWLKGLKENVILGGVIPAGTGSREVIWQITLEGKRRNLSGGGIRSFNEKIRNIFLHENTFPIFPTIETIHDILGRSIS